MARDMFKFVNTVGWKNDIESFRRLKKEVKGFKKEIDTLYKGVNKNLPKSPFSSGGGGGGSYSKNHQHLVDKEIDRRFNKEVKREEDLHKLRESRNAQTQQSQNQRVRGAVAGLGPQGKGSSAKDSALADMLRKEDSQAKFVAKQEEAIRNFMISNRQLREMSATEKKLITERLKSNKTLKDTRFTMRAIKAEMSDSLANQKRTTREMQKQNALAKRMEGSFTQMGTAIASAYTGLALGQSVVRTGIAFESINKTLLSVTGNSADAKEEFRFLEEEAARLGLSIQDSGKAYAKLLAAGKGKLPTEDIREMFTAVSEAGTVLGLSQDDLSGGIRA